MKVYSANEIRNVAVLGHSGCGKTTLMEAALFAAQVTSRMGRVEDGNTVSDYDDEEKRRKVSVGMSMAPVEWLNNKINLMDTPGYFDFAGEVRQALAAADATLILLSAKSGIEVGTTIAWEYAKDANLPRVLFVNGMDDEHADFNKVVDAMKAEFGTSVVPLQLPIVEGGKLTGYADILAMQAYKYGTGKPAPCDMPAHLADEAEAARASIVEAVAETDEALMEKFFNDEALTPEEINAGIRNGFNDGSVTPVLCGVATTGTGVTPLLDMFVNLMPPASELRTELAAVNPNNDEEITIKCAESEPLAAFVFKTIADPYVGRLSIFRVFAGTVKRDTPLWNANQEIPEKAGHLYVMRGKEQIEVDEIKAGDIGAIAKLSGTSTQDTLCLKSNPVCVPPINFPESLLSMAVVPKGKGDEDKISTALSKILEEDKTIKYEINKDTKQAVVSGVGDNQLDVMVNRLKTRYKIDVELTTPLIAYREMIKGKVNVRGRHKKQSGGRGQFGDVVMDFEPSGDLNKQYVFEEKIFGGSVPKQYHPAVEKGIQDSVLAGPLAAYPVYGLKATLMDGSYHDVDSSEMAFKLATIIAFKDGFMKAKPTLLEPIMSLAVTVPKDYTGDVMGDMSKRRGRILGTEEKSGKQVIAAEAPMAELQKYPIDLRAMTQGRGSFSMKFERYEEAPGEVQQKVIEARRKELEAMREKE